MTSQGGMHPALGELQKPLLRRGIQHLAQE